MAASDWTGKFSYLRKSFSAAELSRESGIPYRVILSASKRGGELPSAYNANARTLWAKKSYSLMKEAGAPTAMANTYRGGSVENVQSVAQTIRQKIEYWARGATLMHFNLKRLRKNSEVQQRYYQDMIGKITKGLATSQAELKEIVNFDIS